MKKFDISEAIDGELLARFERVRDQSAFAEVVRRHGPMVLAVARRNLNSREDAEDAFQATFMALAAASEKIRNKGRISAWLHGTVRKTASCIRRSSERRRDRLQRVRDLAMDVNTTTGKPSAKTANDELLNALDEEIGKLPRQLQSAVVLCCLEGQTQEYAAKQIGVSASAVRDRLNRAKKLLKDRLVRRGIGVGITAVLAHTASSTKASAAISNSLIAETTTGALLFAASESAALTGVNSCIIDAANQIITSMKIAKYSIVGLAGLAALSLSIAVANIATTQPYVGTLFLDNFDDGNHADGSPVTWTASQFQSGDIDASSGDLVLSANARTAGGVGVGVENVTTSDTSVRTQMRLTRPGASALVGVRIQSNRQPRNYFAGVTHTPQLGGSFLVAGRSDGIGNDVLFRSADDSQFILLDHNVTTEDTLLQFDAIGDELRVWAWGADSGSMPPEPQFSVQDSTYSKGFIGVILSTNNQPRPNENSEAAFRYVHLSNTSIGPELDNAGMAFLVLASLTLILRRRQP